MEHGHYISEVGLMVRHKKHIGVGEVFNVL